MNDNAAPEGEIMYLCFYIRQQPAEEGGQNALLLQQHTRGYTHIFSPRPSFVSNNKSPILITTHTHNEPWPHLSHVDRGIDRLDRRGERREI